MRLRSWCSLFLGFLACLFPLACGSNAEAPDLPVFARPLHKLSWEGRGGGFKRWHCGAEFLCGVHVIPETLDVWKWNADRVDKVASVTLESGLVSQWLEGGRYIVEPLKENVLVMKRAADKQELKRWEHPEEWWYCDFTRLSRNGRWVAVGLVEEPTKDPPDHDTHRPRIQLGLLNPSQDEIKWLPVLRAKSYGAGQITAIACSDDGAYVGVTGWNWGAAVIDVAANKVLWEVRPKGEAGSRDLAFSPDSKIVYVGGTQGCVYGMDARTGAIKTQWFASRSGKEEYGHRIECMAVSPDGRFVAAGTGPEGEAYVWRADTGDFVGIFFHSWGTMQLVMFSPDSKQLATFVPGSIKVWRLPGRIANKPPDQTGKEGHTVRPPP